MQTPDIDALLRERQALRGLADMAIRFRGELGQSGTKTDKFIESLIDQIIPRWVIVDERARRALKHGAVSSLPQSPLALQSPPHRDQLAMQHTH